jgi:hypothetical protein
MIAHYVIFRKLIGYNPKFARVLEIGPGCGYLSFFLRHHAYLKDYSQVESTEAFYLLQSHINSHVFGARFSEHAISQRALADHNFYVAKMKWYNEFHFEEQKILELPRTPVCNHYPWWRLGDVAERRFDIISSNANLNEFSREALIQYLSVIRDVLTDDGAIIAQCLGGGAPTYDSVFATIKSVGFVPVALLHGDADPGRNFVVTNGVFVGKNHPLYAAYADRRLTFSTWDRDIDFINRMYFINEEHRGKKRIFSAQEVLNRIEERYESAAQRDVGVVPVSFYSDRAVNGGGSVSRLSEGPVVFEQRAVRKIAVPARHIEVNRLRLIGEIEAKKRELERTALREPPPLPVAAAEPVKIDPVPPKERTHLKLRVAQLSAEVQALRNSRSWRVTAPLRQIPPGPRRFLRTYFSFLRPAVSKISTMLRR